MRPQKHAVAASNAPTIPDYELLRPIGSGSYGDVWLARSTTGLHRAVKVVARAKFGENQVPFEREFTGLKRFEPVSRNHENLVDVLHAGQRDELLFYVMELADDANASAQPSKDLDPSAYQPDTLRGRLDRQGRLPLTECLQIAGSLASALDHLHTHDLVHRDVKPSNIVFVGGVPKLADVGLVAGAEATFSLVGTEGFIPPEGPGTPEADIFALGKILYEMSSGLDRMQFPTLPSWLHDDPGRARWVEFNELVLHCCERNPGRRYATAAEILADLALLEEGGSLVGQRRWRQLSSRTRKAGIFAMVAAGLFALGAILNPWDSEPLAPAPPEAPFLLSAAPLDLGQVKIAANIHQGRRWDVSPDGSALVISSEGMHLWDRERKTTRALQLRNQDGWDLFSVRWMSGGKLVCLGRRPVLEDPEESESAVLMIDIDQERIVETLYHSLQDLNGLAVAPRSGRMFFAIRSEGSDPVGLVCLTIGDPEPEVWSENHASGFADVSPDERWVAVHKRRSRNRERERPGHDIWLVRGEDGHAVRITDRDGFDGFPVWAPDGNSLFYVSGSSLWETSTRNLWEQAIDPDSGRPVGEPRQLSVYKDTQVDHLQVVAATGELVFGVSSDSSKIYAGRGADDTGALELVGGRGARLSEDGRWVYYLNDDEDSVGLYRIVSDGATSPTRLTDRLPLGFDPSDEEVAMSMVEGERAKIVILDPVSGMRREIAETSGKPDISPRWSPDRQRIAFADGADLLVVDREGLHRKVLGSIVAWEGWTIRWSPDGSFLAGLGQGLSPAGDTRFGVFVYSFADEQLRNVTPWEETGYREGLEWHPGGEELSFVYYASDTDSEIRLAYPDGRPGALLIDQDDHWDYIGTWHPDGDHFYFQSYGQLDHRASHIFERSTRSIRHGGGSSLPQWSRDGTIRIWSETQVTRGLRIADCPRGGP